MMSFSLALAIGLQITGSMGTQLSLNDRQHLRHDDLVWDTWACIVNRLLNLGAIPAVVGLGFFGRCAFFVVLGGK